jgi:hypothetical protein
LIRKPSNNNEALVFGNRILAAYGNRMAAPAQTGVAHKKARTEKIMKVCI